LNLNLFEYQQFDKNIKKVKMIYILEKLKINI